MTNRERRKDYYIIRELVALSILGGVAISVARNWRVASEYPPPTLSPIVTEISDQGQGCDYNNVYDLCYWTKRITDVNPNLDPRRVEADLTQIAKQLPGNEGLCLQITPNGLIPSDATGGVLREGPEASINIPEGGWGYIATGHVTVRVSRDERDIRVYDYKYISDNVYLIFIKGKQNYGEQDDQNTTVILSNYPKGHVFVNQAAPSDNNPAINAINTNWFVEQIFWAAHGASNCGTGCKGSITMVIIDLNTGEEQVFKIDPKTFQWNPQKSFQRNLGKSFQHLRQKVRQEESDKLAMLRGDNTSKMTKPNIIS